MGARIPIESNFVMSNYNSLGYLRYQLMIYLVFSNTRSYGPLCGPTSSSCSLAAGLWPSARGIFGPLGKKDSIMQFWPILGHSWCPVVTLDF